jgi:hypothetical protein
MKRTTFFFFNIHSIVHTPIPPSSALIKSTVSFLELLFSTHVLCFSTILLASIFIIVIPSRVPVFIGSTVQVQEK